MQALIGVLISDFVPSLQVQTMCLSCCPKSHLRDLFFLSREIVKDACALIFKHMDRTIMPFYADPTQSV